MKVKISSSMSEPKGYTLFNNSRFYILIFSLLLSVSIFSFLRIQIPSDQLFYIRTQQIFGFVCIAYWYVALMISPIGYVIGKHRTKHLEFARRAIGVSAFYFALLHGTIALWGQLGGPGQLQYLPSLFRWSLVGGAIAFSTLFLMAATSLDKVVNFMTFRRWKWLHRLGYLGGILAILHIWMIGTHLAYGHIRLIAFIALVILSGFELFRAVKLLNEKHLHLGRAEAAVLHASLWSIVIISIIALPSLVQNYHSRHEDTNHVEVHK